MKQREQESGSLTGPGLGLTRDILTFECQRQGLALDGRALNETGFGDSSLQTFGQRQVRET
jgi:hypothetical protein